jgi:hypothetical protein
VAALFTHFIVFVYASIDCAVGFDTDSVGPPASASPQGWICSEEAHGLGLIIWWGGFVLSLIATVALIVLAWRRWSVRGGVPALALVIVMPLVTTLALNLPSDNCTAHARSTHPHWACIRG